MLLEYLMITSVITLLLSITVLILLVNQWIRWRLQNRAKLQGLPYVSMPSFVWTLLVTRGRFDLIEKRALETHGPIYASRHFNRLTVTIAEPTILQTILNHRFDLFANRRPFVNFDPVFSRFVFVAQDEQWRRIRGVMAPTFAVSKLAKIKSCIDDTVKTMIENLWELSLPDTTSKPSNINMKQVLSAFTMDTIIRLGYGLKVNSLGDPQNPIIRNAHQLFSTNMSIKNLLIAGMIMVAPKLSDWLGLRFNREVVDYFTKLSMEIIERKRAQLSGKATNFVELLLEADKEAHDLETSKYLTNEEIVAQCVLFFLAGFDTTSTAISMTCFYLALYPEIQETLFEEINEEFSKIPEEEFKKDQFERITPEVLNRFRYLNAVVLETMRICPPATAPERMVSKDFELEAKELGLRFQLKKGDIVRVPIYALHHDPRFWSEPEVFRPERFLATNSLQPTSNHRGTFLPFGSGPRSCLAKGLAMMEIKLAVLHMIRCFKLKICDKTTVPVEFFAQPDLLVPKDIVLTVERRV